MPMKIGHKIAVIYSALTVCAAALVSVVLFFWMSGYTNNLYYSFLEDRAMLIAQKDIDSRSMNTTDKERLHHRQDSFIRSSASQIIINAEHRSRVDSVLGRWVTPADINRLYAERQIEFHNGETLGVAIYYPRGEGDIIVVATSNHRLAAYMHSRLGWLLVGVIAVCAIMIVLVSKLYALKRINTLDEAYHREKQFVHHASHELNNPLTAIQGECEIALLKPRTAGEYQDSLGRIEQESRRMIQTIRQLLYLSLAMDNPTPENVEPIALEPFLGQFATDRVRLVVHQQESAPTVKANPFLLKMAVGNIVRNALKYSTAEVVIELSAHSLSIADHGIGIPKKDLAYIFQPFYRASNTHTYQGNGVGMSLANQILKLYGIKMKVTSVEGKGTQVVLSF